jgi:putative protease
MADTKVGEIIHFYDKISVAVVKVLAPIKVGDRIKITGHDKEFEQAIDSMQIEHESIEKAKKGDDVGMKVDQAVKQGDEVYKVE